MSKVTQLFTQKEIILADDELRSKIFKKYVSALQEYETALSTIKSMKTVHDYIMDELNEQSMNEVEIEGVIIEKVQFFKGFTLRIKD